jgi:hypothetical protein
MSKEMIKALLGGGEPLPGAGIAGILAHNFRMIIKARQIDEDQWGVLMDAYIAKLGPLDRKDSTALRGNLAKEFGRPTMTWKTYVKALHFLGFTRVDFGIAGEGVGFTLDPVVTRVVWDGPPAADQLDEE